MAPSSRRGKGYSANLLSRPTIGDSPFIRPLEDATRMQYTSEEPWWTQYEPADFLRVKEWIRDKTDKAQERDVVISFSKAMVQTYSY